MESQSGTLLVSHSAVQERPRRLELSRRTAQTQEKGNRHQIFCVFPINIFTVLLIKKTLSSFLKDFFFFCIKHSNRNPTKIDLNLNCRPALGSKSHLKIAKAQDVSESCWKVFQLLHGRPKERTPKQGRGGVEWSGGNNERKHQDEEQHPSPVSTQKTSTPTYRASKTRPSGT